MRSKGKCSSGRRTACLLLAASFALQASSVFAVEDRSRWSIAVKGGRAVPMSPTSFSKAYNDGNDFGLRIKQEVNIDWAVAGDFSSESVKQMTDLSQKIVAQPMTVMAFR